MTTANPKSTGQFGKGNPGKPKGALNKTTTEFRETVTKLLDDNRDNVGIWLKQVAEGIPADDDGKGAPADPGRALDLLAKLAEFAAPKLNRTEHTGEGGGPVDHSLTVRFVK